MKKSLNLAALLASAAPRGVFAAPRADVSTDPKAMLGQLNAAWEEFKTTHADSQSKRDTLTEEKLGRIDASIATMQEGMDSLARQTAAAAQSDQSRVVDADYTGNFVNFMRHGEDGRPDVKAALKKATDAEGGYLAPVEWDRTIVDALVELSPMRSICSVQSVTGSGFKKVVNSRGTSSGWVDEDDARTETNTPTLGSYTYAFGEIYANPAATQQMLEDAEFDLESWLAGEISTEFALKEGVAFISGDGSKKPTGLLTYVTGAANAAAHPLGAVTLTNSGNAALLNSPDTLITAVHEVPSVYRQNAGFVMNRTTLSTVRKFKDTTNQYLWQPSYAQGQPQTLLGHPVTEVAGMPDIAANAIPIMFGDFMRGYLILDRRGAVILRDPYTNKPYVHFYTTKRVGGGILNPEALQGIKIAV